MKLKIAAIASFIAASLSASVAQATSVDLGTLAVGQSETLFTDTSSTGGFYSSLVTGILPNNSKITFTYTLNNFSGLLSDQANYNFNTRVGGVLTHFEGSSFSTSSGLGSSQGSSNVVGSPVITTGDSLALTSANITGNVGTTVITNTSISTVTLASVLLGFLSAGGSVTLSYTVAALSNVPLPPSATLFGIALLALAGYNAYKRKQLAA